MSFHRARLSPPEEKVAVAATRFAASAFRGRGVTDRVEASTLDAALEAAPTLYQDRGVMIYAFDDGGRFAMLGSWYPDTYREVKR